MVGKKVIVAALAGVMVSGAFVLNQRAADDSLQMVGYTKIIPTHPIRPWWVELHDHARGLSWAHQIASTKGFR